MHLIINSNSISKIMKQTKIFCVSASTSYKLQDQINDWLISIKEGQSKKLYDIKLSTVVTPNQVNIYALAIYDDGNGKDSID